jgi:hypothetical protein
MRIRRVLQILLVSVVAGCPCDSDRSVILMACARNVQGEAALYTVLTVSHSDHDLSGPAGSELTETLSVRVVGTEYCTDTDGDEMHVSSLGGMAGVQVIWTVLSDSSGFLQGVPPVCGATAGASCTDGSGIARAKWTLGLHEGEQAVQATVIASGDAIREAEPLIFRATALRSFSVIPPESPVQLHANSQVSMEFGILRSSTDGPVQICFVALPAGLTGPLCGSSGSGYRSQASTAASGSARANETVTVTLDADANPAVGVHTLTVRGLWNSLEATAGFMLIITPPPSPAIALAVVPADLEVTQGAAGSVDVTIIRTGAVGDVTLSAAQVTAVTSSFAPNPAPEGISALTLQVAADAAPGTYLLTVTGTSGAVTANADLTLRIEESSPSDVIVLQDDFEGANRWVVSERRLYRDTATNVYHPMDDNPWQYSFEHLSTGGNPDGHRRMTNTLTGTTAPTFVQLYVEHTFTRADGSIYEYDPRTEGAIRNLDFIEDRVIAQFLTQGSLFVRQNGIVYMSTVGSSIDHTDWQRVEGTGLTAADFPKSVGQPAEAPARPDFSANGTPLQFGFSRATSARFPITHVHSIDNWRVSIKR